MIKIQKEEIDILNILERIKNPESGGIVTFLGTVRENSKDHVVSKMEIEVYEDMALRQLEAIRSEAKEKFDVHEINIVHRYGELNVQDNIVFIAVAARHRKGAFDACIFVIDELKKRVPIWKKEITPEGDFWVDEKNE
jgi:molybdopterin synthase catalytic subunit